jgi:5-methylthioadenosine/S-adenosylhomocysteine deaminase
MDLAAKLQKISRMDPCALPAKQVLEMATLGGAQALHLWRRTKKHRSDPHDTKGPHATPMYNVYSQLVYALKGSDVKTVIIDGKLVMEHRRTLTLNEEEILEKAHAYQKRVIALHSVPVTTGPSRLF